MHKTVFTLDIFKINFCFNQVEEVEDEESFEPSGSKAWMEEFQQIHSNKLKSKHFAVKIVFSFFFSSQNCHGFYLRFYSSALIKTLFWFHVHSYRCGGIAQGRKTPKSS